MSEYWYDPADNIQHQTGEYATFKEDKRLPLLSATEADKDDESNNKAQELIGE